MLKKSGNELTERDDQELRRVATGLAALQKQCDASRKSSKQHTALIQVRREVELNGFLAPSTCVVINYFIVSSESL